MDVTAKPARGGKRERLIEGARQLIYRQGVERTTLADVAAQTDVPVGNIYYYFKTKDDLLDAVVQAHSEDRDSLLARLDQRRTPRARLKALIEELDGTRQSVSQYGCPFGTLSAELDKRTGTEASSGSQELLGTMVDWAEAQFRQMGQQDPRDLAITLIAAYEGTTILTHSLRDPGLMHRQSKRLQRWIDSLPEPADAATQRTSGLPVPCRVPAGSAAWVGHLPLRSGSDSPLWPFPASIPNVASERR